MYSPLCDITWDRVSSIAPLCDKTRVSVSLLCLTLHSIVPVYACGLVLLCLGLGVYSFLCESLGSWDWDSVFLPLLVIRIMGLGQCILPL